jgi:hypothetical protein
MGRHGSSIVGLMTALLLALDMETWAQRKPVPHPRVEASLEVVQGRLVLALSASQETPEAMPLRVEISLEKAATGLIRIGAGTLVILPGASLRLPVVINEPGGEEPVRVDPETTSLVTIHSERRLVLYRQGPLRATEAPPLGTALRLERGDPPARRFPGASAGDPSVSSRTTDLTPVRTEWREVSLAMRLLAAEAEEEAAQLIVEVAAPDLSGEGVFEIEWQGKRSERRLRLGAQASLQLPLPSPEGPLTGEDLPHHARPIRYALRRAPGDLLLSGEVTLVALLEQEEAAHGEVGPFQFDRGEYLPGESLEVRIGIRGRASAGYRLVLVGREESGNIFSRTETEVPDSSEPLTLVIALPGTLHTPAVLEYQLLDRQTGFLYQSGQQSIPLRP